MILTQTCFLLFRRTAGSTSTTDRYKNTSRGSDSKMPTDVNTLQEKLRETQSELDDTKTKLEKALQVRNVNHTNLIHAG